jgi:hypothetical protein
MKLKALVDVALSIGRLERVVHHPASVKWTACPTQVVVVIYIDSGSR